MGVKSTQSRKRGQGAELPCGVWGNAPTVPRATNSKDEVNKGAGSEASLPVTLRIRRCAPQLALSITSTLPRPLARPSSSSFLFMLAHCDTQGFRLCGGDEGAMKTDECLRSPPRPLRCALPCFLVFIVESGTRLRALLRDRPR